MHRGTAGSDLAATQVSSLITYFQEQELSSTTPTVPSVFAHLCKQDILSDWRGLPGRPLLVLLNPSLHRRTKEIGKSQLLTIVVDTAGTSYLQNSEAA